MTGMVIKCGKGLFDVILRDEEKSEEKIVYSCCMRGIFRHEKTDIKKVLTGDKVIFEVDASEQDPDKNAGVITQILPRKNALSRPPAANIDTLFVVAAVKSPAPDFLHIDKITAVARHNNIESVIVINKTDLGSADEIEKIENIYSKAGFKVIKTSTVEEIGETSELYSAMKGNICAFCGSSGVGKTSILNALFPDLSLETGEVSEKIQRGRHTTKSVELFAFGDGFIADTPGFNILDFEKFDYFSKEDTVYAFPDLERYALDCKFTKCSHTKEEGCAVLRAMEEGEVMPSRHKSYVEIFNQLKNKNSWDKKI